MTDGIIDLRPEGHRQFAQGAETFKALAHKFNTPALCRELREALVLRLALAEADGDIDMVWHVRGAQRALRDHEQTL